MTSEQIKIYALSKKYTDETVIGGGAIKGSPCTIDKIEDIEGGHKVTFKWTLADGTVKTDSVDIMDGTDGIDGVDGFSPEITVKTSTDSRYILHIVTADGEFDTPNLKGGGSGGTSNYEALDNLPYFNGHEWIGNLTPADVGLNVTNAEVSNDTLIIS